MLVTFIGVLLYHTFLHLRDVEYFRKVLKPYTDHRFNKNFQAEEGVKSRELKVIEAPNPTDTCLKRESLIDPPV